MEHQERPNPEALAALLYPELRALAAAQLAHESPGHTLQPTALANEVYLKLTDQTRTAFVDRRHCLSVAATLIRRILIDHARAKKAGKRGGGQIRLELTDDLAAAPDSVTQLVELDDAMNRLSALSPRQARVFELRYFGGMEVPDVAALLNVSEKSIVNDWRFARAWLQTQFSN